MNVRELEKSLVDENFPPGSYNLRGEFLDGGYTLRKKADRWIIEYSDRELPCFVAEFAVEADACDFFLRKMRQLVPDRKGFSGHA
jgi:hypothetical protein